jgi:hypothetical protein
MSGFAKWRFFRIPELRRAWEGRGSVKGSRDLVWHAVLDWTLSCSPSLNLERCECHVLETELSWSVSGLSPHSGS